MNWKKTGYDIKANGEKTIQYESPQAPNVVIESRKKAYLHANGHGYWYKTTYFLIHFGDEEKEFWTLKDAKEAAERKSIGASENFRMKRMDRTCTAQR